jgi:hypothetical protein
MDLALRSPAVGVVIADGGGLDMAATRRLQLLARSESKWALVARTEGELAQLSAAQTRWGVCAIERSPRLPLSKNPDRSLLGRVQPPLLFRWNVELLRCKGLRPVSDHRAWIVEWNHAQGAVHLSAPLADVVGEAAETSEAGSEVRRSRSA